MTNTPDTIVAETSQNAGTAVSENTPKSNENPASAGRPEKFVAANFVKAASLFCAPASHMKIGAFGFLVQVGGVRQLNRAQIDRVYKLIYEKHLKEATHPLVFGNDFGPTMQSAYMIKLENQKLFNFIVCASLYAFHKEGSNLVENKNLRYEVMPEISSLVSIRREFRNLRTQINRKNQKAPWIQDCIRAFGKEEFLKWVDGQIEGINCIIPSVVKNDVAKIPRMEMNSDRSRNKQSGAPSAGKEKETASPKEETFFVEPSLASSPADFYAPYLRVFPSCM